MAETYQLVRLSEDTMDDFISFHNTECDYGPCYCMYWWVDPDGWEGLSATEKLLMRNRMSAEGRFDGYLLYGGDTVEAWCQCARRDEFPHICELFDGKPEAGVWAVTCFLVKKGMRHKGIMERMLDLVLEDLRGQGAHAVEAYPRRLEAFDEMYAWTGPEQSYVDKGFRFIKYIEGRCVYRYDFPSTQDNRIPHCIKKEEK